MNHTKAQWMRIQRIKAELAGRTPGVPLQVVWTQTTCRESWCPDLYVFDYDVEDPECRTQVIYDRKYIMVHRRTARAMFGL